MDMTSIRASYAAQFFGDALTNTRTGATITGKLGYQALQNDRSGALRVLKGAYKLQCGVTVDAQLDDVLTFGTHTYRVVDAPPVTALAFCKVLGLEAVS